VVGKFGCTSPERGSPDGRVGKAPTSGENRPGVPRGQEGGAGRDSGQGRGGAVATKSQVQDTARLGGQGQPLPAGRLGRRKAGDPSRRTARELFRKAGCGAGCSTVQSEGRKPALPVATTPDVAKLDRVAGALFSGARLGPVRSLERGPRQARDWRQARVCYDHYRRRARAFGLMAAMRRGAGPTIGAGGPGAGPETVPGKDSYLEERPFLQENFGPFGCALRPG